MSKIGVFDSGYGGLTILKELVKTLPAYDYIYLGDNARAPYGTRSFETVYDYTYQCVQWLFAQGCELVILACNTASAKALRTIQQTHLPANTTTKRVLGVIRPTTEIIGSFTSTQQVGVLATAGTINSNSYVIETAKFHPQVTIHQLACPMWVPLVENNEHNSDGANYFVKEYIQQLLAKNSKIDAVLLACTHYPLLLPKIKQYLPPHINVITQGSLVAKSLQQYLQRHLWLENQLSKNNTMEFYTTDSVEDFNTKGSLFFERTINSKKAIL